MQALVSTLGPLHAPLHADALDCIDPIHMRMRSCTPEPHDLLHLLQSPHLLHPKNSTREWFTLIRQINLLPWQINRKGELQKDRPFSNLNDIKYQVLLFEKI